MGDVQAPMGRVRALLGACAVVLATSAAHADALDDATRARAAFAAAKTPRDREDAQYEEATALYRARLYAVAYAIFSEIASHPTHAHHGDALPWLARLAGDLPEPADVAERVGKYDEDAIAAVDATLKSRLFYLLGRYRDRNHQYEDARRAYARVETSSAWYPKARFLMGVVAVKQRKPAEAIAAFQNVVDATQESDDYDRLRNLALLSIARTYYSTAVRIDARGAAVTDRALLAKAIAFWNAVDVADASWEDVLLESSWALFLTGDHARALGNLHMLEMMTPRWRSPEADELRATIHLASCRYDDVATLAARSLARRRPVAAELRGLVASTGREDASFFRMLRDVRDGRGPGSPELRALLEATLSDRQLLRHLQWAQMLVDEQRLLGRSPRSFVSSPAFADARDVLQLEWDLAARDASRLARERLVRAQGELDDAIERTTQLLAAANAGRAGRLDEDAIPARVPAREADRNVVRGDDEHVIWPFTGEIWRDEAGTYRQSIRTMCR